MSDLKITIEDHPSADEDAIVAGLYRYNAAQTGDGGYSRLTLTLRDGGGAVKGGLIGELYWGWLHVDVLWVEEGVRGQGYGGALLGAAEQEAVVRGCRAAYLGTFSFQAPGFYERHGYKVFGVLEQFPVGHRRHFFYKRL
jgi:GNAT superfamily N-acetyltransferase